MKKSVSKIVLALILSMAPAAMATWVDDMVLDDMMEIVNADGPLHMFDSKNPKSCRVFNSSDEKIEQLLFKWVPSATGKCPSLREKPNNCGSTDRVEWRHPKAGGFKAQPQDACDAEMLKEMGYWPLYPY